MYINQGRFGEFVRKFIETEYSRIKFEAEKDSDLKLWIAYIHSLSEDDFETYKNRVTKSEAGNSKMENDHSLDDDGIVAIIESLFPDDGGVI